MYSEYKTAGEAAQAYEARLIARATEELQAEVARLREELAKAGSLVGEWERTFATERTAHEATKAERDAWRRSAEAWDKDAITAKARVAELERKPEDTAEADTIPEDGSAAGPLRIRCSADVDSQIAFEIRSWRKAVADGSRHPMTLNYITVERLQELCDEPTIDCDPDCMWPIKDMAALLSRAGLALVPTAEWERSRYKGCGSYPRAIGEIEAALGISGEVPLSETVEAVRELARRAAKEANGG